MLGWKFPARTTAFFLVVASLAMGVLAFAGLREIHAINAEHSDIRVDRAGRAAAALFEQRSADFVLECDVDGSPQKIQIDAADRLEPSDSFDSLVDSISSVNQGAANIFRRNPTTGSFDRIATSRKDESGARIGASQVEPGLIVATHPAYATVTANHPYLGEVPVAGGMRYAYLIPIVDAQASVVGILAVDVGWVDDLNRINERVANRVVGAVLLLLGVMAVAGVIVMYFAFRPMNRLIKVAHDLGTEDAPDSIQLTHRRDEIGYLAQGLAKVVELQRDLAHRAYNDLLTGIPNRAAFIRELERRFTQLGKVEDPGTNGFALLIVDLDGFKEVNDGLGHQAGDELLISLTASLRSALGPGEFVARLGGDEFAILTAPGVVDIASVQDVTDRVTADLSGVRRTCAGDTSVTASIGIALIPEHGMTSEVAMSHADLALYAVKRNGRGHSRFYECALSSPIQRRMHLTTELRRAIIEKSIRLEYQPIVDACDGQIRAVEALARWTHEVEGEIPPNEFVCVAETAGLIDELGSYVIEQACAQIATWRGLGFAVPVVAVNVSTMQLWKSDFVDLLRESMQRHDIEPDRLCLELTESVLIQHEHEQHRWMINELAELGVGLSVDDFGTGYSSLSYLHNLPVDQIKIDRAFLARAATDAKRAQLFAGIVSLAHNLGLNVVAEGVGTDAELALAQVCGCDLVQGFHLDGPMPADIVCSRFDTVNTRWAEQALLPV